MNETAVRTIAVVLWQLGLTASVSAAFRLLPLWLALIATVAVILVGGTILRRAAPWLGKTRGRDG
jgi:hypothetical protein